MPFVNQSWCIPVQHDCGGKLGQRPVLEIIRRIANQELAIAVMRRSPGFATPFGAFYAHCAENVQILAYHVIDNSRFILRFFSCLSHNALYLPQLSNRDITSHSTRFNKFVQWDFLVSFHEILHIHSDRFRKSIPWNLRPRAYLDFSSSRSTGARRAPFARTGIQPCVRPA